MEKKFSKTEIASIKRIARNAAPYIAKRNNILKALNEKKANIEQQVRETVQKRIEKMEAKAKEDIEFQQKIINSIQSYVVELTGFGIEDLVIKTSEGTGKIDPVTNKEIMRTVYALKYPETVIPVDDAPSCEAPVAETEEPEASEEHDNTEVEEFDGFPEAEPNNEDPFADNDNWD